MYAKIFAQIYDGTLATVGPWEAMVTFQQFLILSDKFGVVDMTPLAISRRTSIPLEIIERGITALEQPDPDSRTPDEEGRRIVRINHSRSWGWRIVNRDKYRDMRTAEDRREYMRDYMQERRKKSTKPVNSVNSRKQLLTVLAETETETEKKHISSSQTPRRRSAHADFRSEQQSRAFDEFWQAYWRKVGKLAAKKAYIGKVTSTGMHAAVMVAIAAQTPTMLARDPENRPHASSWLNAERWNDEIAETITPKSQIEKLMEAV